MLLARGDKNIFMGLSEENLQGLREGKPIHIDLKTLGLEGTLLVVYGRSEMDIVDKVVEAGAGDEAFRQKAKEYFGRKNDKPMRVILSEGKTVTEQ